MLGAVRRCPNCGGSSFERTPTTRATQCLGCHMVLEERTRSALPEHRFISLSEELHWAVTPDMMRPLDSPASGPTAALGAASATGNREGAIRNSRAAPIPGDPITTPGFVTAFRVIAPLQTPLFGATAGSMSGALSEMERLLGPLISENDDFDSRGDARPVVAVYFEILDISGLLDIDSETSNLAVQLFCHTARTMFIKNKEVEQMAAASLLVASDIRRASHKAWLESRSGDDSGEGAKNGEFNGASIPPTPEILPSVRIAEMCSLPFAELTRFAECVREALTLPSSSKRDELDSSQPTPKIGSATSGMSRACAASFERVPGFASQLDLGSEGITLASTIVERAYRLDACPRRAPASVSAACVYLTCQILQKKLTQAEVCQVMKVTEVTLRKVYQELCISVQALVPEEYSVDRVKPASAGRHRRDAALRSMDQTIDDAVDDVAFRKTARDSFDKMDVDVHKEGDGDNLESRRRTTFANAMIASDDEEVGVTDAKAEVDLKTDAKAKAEAVEGDVDDDNVDKNYGGDAQGPGAGKCEGGANDTRPAAPDERTIASDRGEQRAESLAEPCEPRASQSPRDPEQKRREAKLLAMLRSNPAAAAAFEEIYAAMPNQTAAPSPSPPVLPPPPPPPLPDTRSAKARRETARASPVSQASPVALESPVTNQVHAKLGSTLSAQVREGVPSTVPPPPPPLPHLKRAGSPGTSRPVLRVRRNDNTTD